MGAASPGLVELGEIAIGALAAGGVLGAWIDKVGFGEECAAS